MNIGWQLDHLMALDTSGKGLTPVLYQAALKHQNGQPLSLTAARALCERIRSGDVIGILTGFPSRSFLLEGVTETDGPVGAAVLARVVEQLLGAVPLIFTEARIAHYMRNCCMVAGLLMGTPEEAMQSKQGPYHAAVGAIVPVSTDREEAQQQAVEYMERFRPSALVAIEQPGLADDGFGYTASGRQIADHLLAKMDYLFEQAKEHGVPRVSIGDNGNEIGMGRIKETVWTCPHGKTFAARQDADYLIVAGNSNWGAYALAAALEAVATGETRVLRCIDVSAILHRCAADGAIDGISSRPEPCSDGTPAQLNQSVIDLMAWIIDVSMRHVGE
jgi:hypothetical protein